MVFSVKTACISETVKLLETTNSNSYLVYDYELSIGATFNDLEWHLKVISAYVIIPTSNISEIIYDTTTKTEIANKKSHDSFQVIRLSMTLAIFQGH